MITTALDLRDLLGEVNTATTLLRRSATVPDEVVRLVDGFESVLDAAAPLRLQADPYLAITLWAAAFRAEKALRHDDEADRRRDLRVALEQFRQALRDIVENRPYGEDVPAREVLAHTVEVLATSQKTLADLLGVSVRQLQRWLAADGPAPAAGDAARIRLIGQLANQLRHTFTGPGVIAWFDREHPVLGRRPADLLADPLRYPDLLGAAAAARAMTA